jgi:hypothetical protein
MTRSDSPVETKHDSMAGLTSESRFYKLKYGFVD